MGRRNIRWIAVAGMTTALAAGLSGLTTAQAAVPTAAHSINAATTPGTSSTASRPAADFSGAVALSNCSGSIVRWSGSQASDKALMLTNGHCYGDRFLGAKEVVVDKPAVRAVTLLNADGSDAGTVDTVRVLYATMSRTDVALYELGETYQQLQSEYGVPALTLAETKPAPKGQPIEVLSGYWKIAYDCNLNGFAYKLHEDVWTWRMSLRYSDGGCQVIGGTSGSPVLDADRVMIGINNTINEDGQRCTFDNPCEEDRQGRITVHQHRGYGEQTYVFYTCLTGTTIDLSKAGCKLAKP